MNEPKLISATLYWDDGTVDEIDQIESWKTNLDSLSYGMRNWSCWKFTIKGGRIERKQNIKSSTDKVMTSWDKFIQQACIEPCKPIQSCPYLLPCGICDKNDEMCSQYQGG